jgi:hypothetical protein
MMLQPLPSTSCFWAVDVESRNNNTLCVHLAPSILMFPAIDRSMVWSVVDKRVLPADHNKASLRSRSESTKLALTPPLPSLATTITSRCCCCSMEKCQQVFDENQIRTEQGGETCPHHPADCGCRIGRTGWPCLFNEDAPLDQHTKKSWRESSRRAVCNG